MIGRKYGSWVFEFSETSNKICMIVNKVGFYELEVCVDGKSDRDEDVAELFDVLSRFIAAITKPKLEKEPEVIEFVESLGRAPRRG